MLDNPGQARKKRKSKVITRIKPAKVKRHKAVVVDDISKLDPNSRLAQKLRKRAAKQKVQKRKSPLADYHKAIPNILEKSEDKSIYIIGGGPSLKDFNWELLRDKNVLSVNRAFQKVPWALATFWTDSRFFKWYQKDLKKFKGLRIACRYSQLYDNKVILVRSTGGVGIDDYPYHIRAGNNSGFAALNVAFHLGANKVYLLGYDMHSEGQNTHWHNGYVSSHNHDIYSNAMMKDFIRAEKEYKKKGVKLYNANIDSHLNHIEKCTLEDALNDSVGKLIS